MLAVIVGHKLFGFFISSFPIFSNDFHSFHNWEKINSMERKTENHETMAGILSCGIHTEKEPLVKTSRESSLLRPPGLPHLSPPFEP